MRLLQKAITRALKVCQQSERKYSPENLEFSCNKSDRLLEHGFDAGFVYIGQCSSSAADVSDPDITYIK